MSSTIRIFNISFQIFGSILLATIMICVRITGRNKRRTDHMFRGLLWSQIGVMMFDALAYYFRGRQGTIAYVGVRAANFMQFLMNLSFAVCFALYVDAFLSRKTGEKVGEKTTWLMKGAVCAHIILLVVNLFYPFIYQIDENNIYSRKPLYAVIMIPIVVIAAVTIAHLIRYWNVMEKSEKIPFLAYVIVPAVSLVLTSRIYGIVFLQIGNTFACTVMFVLIQVEQGKQIAMQEQKLAQSKIDITLSQLRPHFLYNVISSIGVLCLKDPELASDACDRFARYLRTNLDTITQHKLIPFREELNHVQTYVWLEILRFGDDLEVQYQIEAEDFLLPALCVQPIVENAIKHGMMGKDGVCHIKISSYVEGDWAVVCVQDDGIGFDQSEKPTDERSHVGMKNVSERLKLMAHGEIGFQSKKGVGTTVTIKVPKNQNTL